MSKYRPNGFEFNMPNVTTQDYFTGTDFLDQYGVINPKMATANTASTMQATNIPASATQGFMGNLFDGIFSKDFWLGSTNPKTGVQGMGAAMPLLTLGNGLMQGYLGMKQYGLAKDALDQQKTAFGLNYDAQRQTTNAQMRDQAAARYAANPNAYANPDEYMAKNGIKAR